MSIPILKRTRIIARRWVMVQAIVVGCLAVLCVMFSPRAAYSVLLSGVTCILPNAYYAKRLFTHLHGRQMKTILTAFYLGELTKLIMIGVLFVVIIKLVPIDPLAYFGGFFVALLAFACAPLLAGSLSPPALTEGGGS